MYVYLRLIIFSVEDDIPIDSKTFLMTDFVNLKIKSIQFFKYTHKGMIYVCVFIGMSIYTCMITYVYIVFLKKKIP
jgi:hypothetical protein